MVHRIEPALSTMLLALVVGACAPPAPSSQIDAGPIGDASFDPCASDGSPLDTLGCNGGFAVAPPAPDEIGGACSGASGVGRDSCGATASCVGAFGRDTGRCEQACDLSPMLVSTGGCPTGYRCHRFAAPSPLCFRDCDAAHACPYGLTCTDGRCTEPTP